MSASVLRGPAETPAHVVTVGKLRGLQRLAGANGVLALCAIDHCESMRAVVAGSASGATSDGALGERKLELCAALAPHASGIVLDPVYGAAQALTAGAVPRDVGLVVRAEDTGRVDAEGTRLSGLRPAWGAEKTRRMGADAAKLLAYYRGDLPEPAASQRDVVRQFAHDCRQADLPLLAEAFIYRRSGTEARAEFARRRPALIVQAARELTPLGVDVIAVEFPGDLGAAGAPADRTRFAGLCEELDAACEVPWVLLSAGVTFSTFAEQLRIACDAGASGFVAGRVVWEDAYAAAVRPAERRRWLETTGAERMWLLTEIAGGRARPWWAKLGLSRDAPSDVGDDWYATY